MIRAAGLALIAVFALSCGSDGGPTGTLAPLTKTEAPHEGDVEVILGEWTIAPSADELESGETELAIQNDGQRLHEVAIVEGDAEDLPLNDDGSVNEDEIDVLFEAEDIGPDEAEELTVELEKGDYTLFCNVIEDKDVHFKHGMHTELTVS